MNMSGKPNLIKRARALVIGITGLTFVPTENLSPHDGAVINGEIDAGDFKLKTDYERSGFFIDSKEPITTEKMAEKMAEYLKNLGLPIKTSRVSVGSLPHARSYGFWYNDGKNYYVTPDFELIGPDDSSNESFGFHFGYGRNSLRLYDSIFSRFKVTASEIQR